MSGRHAFNKLMKDISLKRRAGIEERKIELREAMALHELCQAIGTSQETLADRFDVLQPAIAKMERCAGIRISSLRKMIEAMGGSLELKAYFSYGDVTITNYVDLS